MKLCITSPLSMLIMMMSDCPLAVRFSGGFPNALVLMVIRWPCQKHIKVKRARTLKLMYEITWQSVARPKARPSLPSAKTLMKLPSSSKSWIPRSSRTAKRPSGWTKHWSFQGRRKINRKWFAHQGDHVRRAFERSSRFHGWNESSCKFTLYL